MGQKKPLVVVLGIGLLAFGATMLGRPPDPRPALVDREGEVTAQPSLAVTTPASETFRTPVLPIVETAAHDPGSSAPKVEDKVRPKDYLAGGVRSFFFSAEAWEISRILASKTLNPRGLQPDDAAATQIRLFCGDAMHLIGPMTKEMASASTEELIELAAAGRAREDRPPEITKSTVDGVEVIEMSLSRPEKGDVQISIGGGNAHVATWAELPKTKQVRTDLALTIMEHLVALARLLEVHGVLTRDEANRIVFTAVEIGSSYT